MPFRRADSSFIQAILLPVPPRSLINVSCTFRARNAKSFAVFAMDRYGDQLSDLTEINASEIRRRSHAPCKSKNFISRVCRENVGFPRKIKGTPLSRRTPRTRCEDIHRTGIDASADLRLHRISCTRVTAHPRSVRVSLSYLPFRSPARLSNANDQCHGAEK